MANVSSSNGLEKRPKLRFPGFDEPWEHKELLHYLVENTDRNKQLKFGKENVLSVSGEYGIVNQIAFQGRSFAGESVADYHVVETDDIVYTKSPLKANPYGIIKVNNGVPGIVSTLYAVYHPLKTVVPRFVDFYFSNDLRLNKFLKPLVNIGAKHDMKVNNTFVLTGMVVFPPLREQQKIVDFLTILDRRIDVQRKKVEALKKYKRGVLSVAFDKHGSICSWETTPYPFAVLASRRSEKYDPRSGEQMPCVELEHIEQETGRIIGSIPSTQQNSIKGVCKSGDTLFGKLRPYLRKYAFVKKDMVCSSEIWSLVPSETIIPEYLFYLVQTDEFIKIANISSGTKMPRAEWSNIEKSVFSVPSKEVQAQIVQTLRRLDSRMLDAIDMLGELQLMKEGLLQQLFI